MATVRVRIVILTVRITLYVCPFNRMAHTANSGTINPADVLTKFLGHATFWPLIKPFLFGRGQPSQVKTQSLFWHGQPTFVQSS
jgi:hypothetical protein